MSQAFTPAASEPYDGLRYVGGGFVLDSNTLVNLRQVVRIVPVRAGTDVVLAHGVHESSRPVTAWNGILNTYGHDL